METVCSSGCRLPLELLLNGTLAEDEKSSVQTNSTNKALINIQSTTKGTATVQLDIIYHSKSTLCLDCVIAVCSDFFCIVH